MRKFAVIGLGHVGATVAYTLVTKGLADELVLIDSNDDKCMAEQYDLLDSLGRLDTHTKIKVQDYSELKDADIIITAFGNIAALSLDGDRFGEFNINTAAAADVGPKIKESGFNQVFGTGTFLDTARMQRAVGQALNQDPKNVTGYVMGEHGESQFTAWSTVRVAGHPIAEVAKENNLDLEDLDKQARRGGWLVFSGKRYTCYAIATCAIKLALAVLSDAHLACPASVYLEKYGCYVGYPAVIGAEGVVSVNYTELPAEEEEKLQSSAEFIAKKVKSLED